VFSDGVRNVHGGGGSLAPRVALNQLRPVVTGGVDSGGLTSQAVMSSVSKGPRIALGHPWLLLRPTTRGGKLQLK
jgi:hypothetical protein